jgi:hypothetical protein
MSGYLARVSAPPPPPPRIGGACPEGVCVCGVVWCGISWCQKSKSPELVQLVSSPLQLGKEITQATVYTNPLFYYSIEVPEQV